MSNVPSRPAAMRLELPSKARDTFKIALVTVFVVLFGWSLISVDLKWGRLIEAPTDMWRLFEVMFDEFPWTSAERNEMIGLMWDSIAMAWVGTLIGAVFAIPMSFLAAENLVMAGGGKQNL